ncbi:hypothetical protein BG004_004252 [Podila humilis]|nr:hypothetical protein BG004_004252 [Podila humilis]
MASFGSPISRDAGTVRRRDIILSTREKQVYGQLWAAADKDNSGFITGADAVPFFAKSGLPPQVLGQIWVLADSDNKGVLGQQGFSIAVKLIAHAQSGKTPSPALINTDAPLPHFDGVTPAKTGDSPATSSSAVASSSEATVTNDDRTKYGSMFIACGPVNGLLDGDKAREVFLKSKLPVDKLSQIWNLADTKQRGSLDITDFTIAMYYIQHTMDGSIATLPSTLPPAVLKACAGPGTGAAAGAGMIPSPVLNAQTLSRQLTGNNMNVHNPVVARQMTGSLNMTSSSLSKQNTGSAPGGSLFGVSSLSSDIPWDVTADEKIKFDRFFDQLDPNGTGIVGGEDASRFFMNSRLPEAVLAQIWDLSDITGSGTLSKDEFAVAMLLINRKNATNAPIPAALPLSMVPPSLRNRTAGLSFSQQDPVRSATMPSVSQPLRRQSFDLLGDGPTTLSGGGASISGGNDLIGAEDLTSRITSETGDLAAMQNQINNKSKAAGDLQAKRAILEKNLSTLSAQKQDFSIRLNQIKTLFENETKSIKDLESALSTIQPQLIKLRDELVASERELSIARTNKDRFLLTLAKDQEENNQIKLRLKQNNDETIRLREELEAKKKDTGRQKGLLEIARRQAAASDSDKQKLSIEIEQETAKAAEYSQQIQSLSTGSPAPLTSISSSGPPPPPAPRGSRKEPPPPPASRGSNNSTPVLSFASRVSPEAEEAFGIPPALRSPTGSFHSVASPRMISAAATAPALSRQSTGSSPFDGVTRQITGPASLEPVAHQSTGSSTFEVIPRQTTGMSTKAQSLDNVGENVAGNTNNAFLNAPDMQNALWSPLTHAAHATLAGQPEVAMSPESESINPSVSEASVMSLVESQEVTSPPPSISQDPFETMAFPAMDTPPVTKVDFDSAFSNFSTKPASQSKLDTVRSAEAFAEDFPDIEAVLASDDTKSKRISAFGFDDDFSATSPFHQTLSKSKEEDEFPPIVELTHQDEDSMDESDNDNEDAFVQAKSSIASPEPTTESASTVAAPSVAASTPEAPSSSDVISPFTSSIVSEVPLSSPAASPTPTSMAPIESVAPTLTGSSAGKKLTAADFSEFETSFGGSGDDFDTAFSGVELAAPKVSSGTAGGKNMSGFDDGFDFNSSFDDAFGSSSTAFGAPNNALVTSSSGANAFGASFSTPFGQDAFAPSASSTSTITTKLAMDLDEAFGGFGASAPTPAQSGGDITNNTGFGNAFGDFEQEFSSSVAAPPTASLSPASSSVSVPKQVGATPPTAATAANVVPAPIDLPGVDELMNMGFTRQQANDALSRYDTVERAANFLLEGGQ